MIAIELAETMECNDAALVAESLKGDRDAFRRIVERYQTLVSSLAYCATGNVNQSEDLAQETFVTAWKQLAELREPAKLRSWLCGITRFLIGKERRRQDREPIDRAESLDEVAEWASPEPLPPERVISEEEKALLWRSLERIPEIYREPLVLFYRERQSIEAVAQDLGLSEDAVKQRLSRGRKLLQEELLTFVAGALKQTRPGESFTLGVIAALPVLATSAKAAAVTAVAGKGSTAANAAAGGGVLSAFLTGGMMALVSLFGVFGFTGRWLGRRMGLASRQSPLGRKRTVQFWRTLAAGFALLILPVLLVPRSAIYAHPWVFEAQTWLLSGFYWVVAAALAIWVWQRRRDAQRTQAEVAHSAGTTDKSYNLWVALGMAGPALMLGSFLFALFFSSWALSCTRISGAEAEKLLRERPDAQVEVHQYRDGSKFLRVILPEKRRTPVQAPLDKTLLDALAEKGISYPTYIEDRDFHNGGVRGWLVLLCTFIATAGTAVLLRRPGTERFSRQVTDTPRAERREGKVLTLGAALGMTVLGLFLILFTMVHAARHLPASEVPKFILEHKDAHFEVFEFSGGAKELWITPLRSRRHPAYIAPADEPTLALLAANRIASQTFVQGRDFGFRGPSPWVTLLCSLVLLAGAGGLLWRVMRRQVVAG